MSRELGSRWLTARSLDHLALAVENQGDDSAAETLSALAGHEPGNEIQNPMGQMILAGLITSTCST